MISRTFFSILLIFELSSVFLTKLQTSGILFSTACNTELVAKPLILGILPSISVILAFKAVFLTSPLVSGIFFSASVIFFSRSDVSVSYLVFKTNPLVSIPFTFVTYTFTYTIFFNNFIFN